MRPIALLLALSFVLSARLSLASSAVPELTPAPLFGDHAVLQRDKPVPVWGAAGPGEKITVTFAGQSLSTTADAAGRWRVDLAPLSASAEPRDLVIAGSSRTVTLHDILVGEVWLASGQSNMERAMRLTYDAPIDIPGSVNYPLIRHFKTATTVADRPAASVAGAWELPGPETTAGFTAVGYYFARDLLDLLRVPVGIVNSTVGGTPVEAWTEADALRADPAYPAVAARWRDGQGNATTNKADYDRLLARWQAAQKENRPKGSPSKVPYPRPPLSGLYNGMIAPLVPYALRGAIWYQGEANVGRASEYQSLFASLIAGWRHAFGQDDFPFFWVQLANHARNDKDGTAVAELREAQTRTLALPATGQAVIVDIGHANDVHPRNKRDVGRRLARLALHRVYGLDLVDSGPVFASARREGAGYRVTFTGIAGGLSAPLRALTGFELAGADRVFHPAEAKIEGDAVLVTSAEVGDPVAVRYAWRNSPAAGLFNDEGLPAVPFRTDDWPASR